MYVKMWCKYDKNVWYKKKFENKKEHQNACLNKNYTWSMEEKKSFLHTYGAI